MRRTLIILILIGVLAVPMYGQRPRFDGLKSEGPIPADLKLSLDELYNQDKQRVRDYNDGKLANRDNVLAASYQVNQLMARGRILYGDPVTRMVERIADTLLKDYPDLRRELRFYTVKSPEVNAFATGQGMIFVNIGLVAQVEDEAQLAFIIGHEIIHYYKKHNIEALSRKKSKSGRSVEEEQLRNFLKYHNRSHQMENEADSLGLILFYIDSPYDKSVCDGVFDVLQYGYLPFDEISFDTNYFSTPYYHLPSGRYLSEVAPITARDDYDDSKSSHPNLQKRRDRTANVLCNYKGGEKFVTITREEFAEVQRLARFECIRQNLIFADYVRAFYDANLLCRHYPDDPFLAEAKAQALYALSKYRAYTNTNIAVGDYREYEGEIQQAYYLFSHLKGDEMSMMALREVWSAHLKYPQSSRLVEMAEDLAVDLNQKHGLSRAAFAAVYDTATVAVDTAQQSAKNQKYERIKQKRRNQQTAETRRFVFTDFMMQDESFGEMLHRAAERHPQDSVAGITPRKNVFLYSPAYYVVDKNDGDIKYRKSDRLENELTGQLASVMAAKGLGTVELTDKSLRGRSSAEEYNEYVAFNEWCNEFWQTKGDYGMSLFTQTDMNGLMDKYDANLLDLSLVLNAEYYGSEHTMLHLMSGLVLLPTLPVQLYRVLARRERTNVTTLMVDTEHGRLLNKQSYDVALRDSKAVVKQVVYDNLNQSMAKVEKKKNAPVSGYMGRRFAFSVDGVLTLNRQGLFSDGDFQFFGLSESAFVRPALRFNAEYVLAANQSLALSYRRNRVSTLQDCFVGMKTDYYGEPYADYAVCRLGETTHNFTLSYRKYYNMSAPLGAFWGIGANYSLLNLNTAGAGTLRLNETGQQLPLNRIGVQIEFGRNFIYFDYLMFSIGVKYALTFSNPFQEKPLGFDAYPDVQQQIHNLNADMMVNNCFLITLGLGVLPF